MKFESKDLEAEVPTLKEFLTNAPSEKIAFKPSIVKSIWGPSAKGYVTIICESFKVFVHKNSVCGEWIQENLTRFMDDEVCLFMKADSLDGRSFEVLEIEGSKTIWDFPKNNGKGIVALGSTPSPKKNCKKSSGAVAPQKAQEGASSLSNDR